MYMLNIADLIRKQKDTADVTNRLRYIQSTPKSVSGKIPPYCTTKRSV